MDELLYKLFYTRDYERGGISLDNVFEFKNRFEKLFDDHFSEMTEHLKKLSVNKSTTEIIKYISIEKDQVLKYKNEKYLEEKLLKENPSTIKEYQKCGMSEEAATQTFCYDKIHEFQFDVVNKSFLKLMALHREYSNDLLFELKRFDLNHLGYNDIHFRDVYNDPSCLAWLSKLFNEYFNELTKKIDTEKDLHTIEKLINTKIQLFNQIKDELSEKKHILIALEKIVDESENDRDTLVMFVTAEMLYKKQHEYIDYALEKLNKLHDIYLPTSEQAPQSKRKQEKKFIDSINHNEKEKLMITLHNLLEKKQSGREVAKVLEALESKNYLLKQSYTSDIVISEFQLQCSKQAINQYLHKGTISKDEIQQIIDILP